MSYYDIDVPCKLLPTCQGDRASVLSVFLTLRMGSLVNSGKKRSLGEIAPKSRPFG